MTNPIINVKNSLKIEDIIKERIIEPIKYPTPFKIFPAYAMPKPFKKNEIIIARGILFSLTSRGMFELFKLFC